MEFNNMMDFMMQLMGQRAIQQPGYAGMQGQTANPYAASIASQIQAMYPGIQAPVVSAPIAAQPYQYNQTPFNLLSLAGKGNALKQTAALRTPRFDGSKDGSGPGTPY